MIRRWLVVAMSLGICSLLASCGQRKEATDVADVMAPAERFVDLMAKGDFSTAVRSFDATMAQAMPAEKLREAWGSLTAKVGAFKRQAGTRTAKEQGYDVAYVTCEFEKGPVDVKVVLGQTGSISGLWFVPPR